MFDKPGQLEIRKTSAQLKIPANYIKKDFYVTKAIQILTNVKNDYYALVFQGGTSLSKGYKVVNRLSEDIDFRVIQKPITKTLGKGLRRKHLRDFRHSLVEALRSADFIVPDESIKVFYEGKFMSIGAQFESSQPATYLKPHIAIECFMGELALAPKTTEITTLIKLTLGEECEHSAFSVNCVALDETAAEKWVALTRRVAGTQLRSRLSDKHLVRHLYDLYHLKKANLLTGEYSYLVKNIMEKDSEQFKKRDDIYAKDPLESSKHAIDLLQTDKQWQQHWDYFLQHMVYDTKKPSFSAAYKELKSLSNEITETIPTS